MTDIIHHFYGIKTLYQHTGSSETRILTDFVCFFLSMIKGDATFKAAD